MESISSMNKALVASERRHGSSGGGPVPTQQGEGDKLYSGTWTAEEQDFVAAICQEFRAGNIPDLDDGATLRCYIAKRLGCPEKRVSKKYERTGYNGRQSYSAGLVKMSPKESKERLEKLQQLEIRFRDSRARLLWTKKPSHLLKDTNGGSTGQSKVPKGNIPGKVQSTDVAEPTRGKVDSRHIPIQPKADYTASVSKAQGDRTEGVTASGTVAEAMQNHTPGAEVSRVDERTSVARLDSDQRLFLPSVARPNAMVAATLHANARRYSDLILQQSSGLGLHGRTPVGAPAIHQDGAGIPSVWRNNPTSLPLGASLGQGVSPSVLAFATLRHRAFATAGLPASVVAATALRQSAIVTEPAANIATERHLLGSLLRPPTTAQVTTRTLLSASPTRAELELLRLRRQLENKSQDRPLKRPRFL